MPRTSIESDRSRSHMQADHYQPANRQEYLFHSNRFHHQQNQQHHASDMRTPVAWALRDATLSHPRSGVPFNMATHPSCQQHNQLHQHNQQNPGFDSISLQQSSSISGHNHHRRHPNARDKKMMPGTASAAGRHVLRTSSPSATTTSSDDRDEIPIVRHPHHRRQQHVG